MLSLANKYGMAFHHLGLAVEDSKAAIIFLTGLGYQIGDSIFDPEQNVNLLMCGHSAMPAVEIIYPSEDPGPLDRLLKQHKDGLVYHMCYATQDLDASIDALEAENNLRLFCISPPKKAVLFDGKPVSFYIISGVGLIEIIDEAPSQTERCK